jgi:ABC-type branched-subunit amino acid transport system substrate-binding protein
VRSRGLLWVAGVVAVLAVVAGIVLVAVQRSAIPADAGTTGEVNADSGGASASAGASPSALPCASSDLVMGGLLPLTGDLAFLGPAGSAAIDLALADIDSAGGVLGQPVTYLAGDSGDAATGLATEAVANQIAGGAQAIVGPAASAVTVSVIDQTIGAGVVLISPSNTGPGLTDYPDEGLYFRMVPSDVAQGSALATVAEGLDLTSGATIARADAYGLGIQTAFELAYAASGGLVEASITYDAEDSNFAGAVAEIAATDPEFVLIAGFDEAASILREMARQGIGPEDVQVLLAEGSVSTTGYEGLPEGTMAGVLGAVPTGDPSVDGKEFTKRLLKQARELTTFDYAAEAYDATILVALAAEYAGCADGRAIARALPEVADAKPGSRTCATYADCLGVIQSGSQPKYEGVSGQRDFNEFGDARWATVEIVRFVTNTRFRPVEVIGPFEVPLS